MEEIVKFIHLLHLLYVLQHAFFIYKRVLDDIAVINDKTSLDASV